MAITTEYSQERELDAALDEVIRKYSRFAPLLDNVKIGACFCIRTDDNEAAVKAKDQPVTIKKVPSDMQVFMQPRLHYLVVVDYTFWENANENVKTYHLHRALSRVKVEVGETIKFSFRKWEIQDNVSTLIDVGPCTEAHAMYSESVRRQLSGVQAVLDRKPKAKKHEKQEPTEEQESEQEPPEEQEEQERPRVIAHPVVKKKNAGEPRKTSIERDDKPEVLDEPDPEPED